MYLLIACTVSWLCLVGAFFTTWVSLPAPLSTTDLIVIIVVGTAALLASRLGVISLLTLLIRLLPNGRVRTLVTQSVLRSVPTILRSSVLAAASASLAVNAAQASPLPMDTRASNDPGASADPASSTLDPGWPTTSPADPPPDPGWPTVPPSDEPESESPDTQPETPPQHEPPKDPGPSGKDTDAAESGESGNAGKTGAESSEGDSAIHIVGIGESLWSIAVSKGNQDSSGGTAQGIVDDIYSANREVIGADPNLIMPGQRLEIQQ